MARYDYRGFVITNDGGPDARWIARRSSDGVRFRADTLQGVKDSVRDHVLNWRT